MHRFQKFFLPNGFFLSIMKKVLALFVKKCSMARLSLSLYLSRPFLSKDDDEKFFLPEMSSYESKHWKKCSLKFVPFC